MAEDPSSSSYIDYETFLDPTFTSTAFANTLVLATNDPNDSPLDLNTPLSRVLFDVQEIDTHLDALTSKSALPLLSHTQSRVTAGGRILSELESQLSTLADGYDRLKREVLWRYENAEEVRLVADRLWHTVKLGRAVSRCLTLGRQLEAQMAEFRRPLSALRKDDHKAMVRSAHTLGDLRRALASETDSLERITLIRTLKSELLDTSERILLSRSEQIISQFSMSGLGSGADSESNGSTIPSFSQAEDTRSRTTSAIHTLYLLSPIPSSTTSGSIFRPMRLLTTLEEYIRRATSSSLASLTSALATLPKLERTLLEVSARCQNLVALEVLLESLKPPVHPMLDTEAGLDELATSGVGSSASTRASRNLLQSLLDQLDTSSLASFFWRTMASQLSPRVHKIIRDGGASARTLKTNRERVRDLLRECVNRGSELPANALSKGRPTKQGGWEREATVMVQSVISAIR